MILRRLIFAPLLALWSPILVLGLVIQGSKLFLLWVKNGIVTSEQANKWVIGRLMNVPFKVAGFSIYV